MDEQKEYDQKITNKKKKKTVQQIEHLNIVKSWRLSHIETHTNRLSVIYVSKYE